VSKFPINVALTVAVGGVIAAILWQNRYGVWTPMRISGLVLLIFGFLLWTVARFQLGNSLTVTAQATQLVQRGLYSKIRNPVYVFGSCTIAGVILFLGRPLWLLIFLIIFPLQIWRARAEAKVLETKFGEQYRSYRASTWF
jgi:protein-S-isoprenylcysteine O-methyltransferase Ste14